MTRMYSGDLSAGRMKMEEKHDILVSGLKRMGGLNLLDAGKPDTLELVEKSIKQ